MKTPHRLILLALAIGLGLIVLRRVDAATKPSSAGTSGVSVIRIAATNFMSFETNSGVRLAIYWDGVIVIDPPAKPDDPETVLTCDRLVVRVPKAGGNIEDILATGNVIIVQGQNRATGERAIYRATNDVVELTGNPVLSTPEGTMHATTIELDRANRKLRAKGSPVVMEIRTDAIGSTNKTLFPPPVPDSKK
jgi:hypothetical protein